MSDAIAEAKDQRLQCRYIEGDIREADYGGGYDLAMMLFGEFNTFPRPQLERVLSRMFDALNSGGRLIVEPQRLDAVERSGREAENWYRANAGLLADYPHICLEEHFWDEERLVATDRYYAIDASSAEVFEYRGMTQGYRQSELADLIVSAGFNDIEFHQSLTGSSEDEDPRLLVVAAASHSRIRKKQARGTAPRGSRLSELLQIRGPLSEPRAEQERSSG